MNHSRTRGTPCRINTILIFILAPPLAFVTIQCWKFNHLSLFNLPQTSRVLELVFPFFSLFWLGIFPHSTKPAPPSLGLAGRTGPHCLSPALAGLSPHPLQNRVPRVQVLLPLPKKSGIAFAVPDFFVSERKDLATRCARRPACGACRGALVAGGDRPALTEATAETSPSALLLGIPIRSPLFPTVPIPSSTQSAPGFAFFWLNRVRFPLFCCFSGAKFSCRFLCILPHSGYKLKPSVIPCRREVSFLT